MSSMRWPLNFLAFSIDTLKFSPELLLQDIYLAGESFAGQYIPYIARTILDKRSALKLRGLLIGNGWIDPLITYQLYLPFAIAHNLVKRDSPFYAVLNHQVEICEQAYSNHTHILEEACDLILLNIVKNGVVNNHYPKHQNGRCVNAYDVRLDDTYPTCGGNWPPDLRYTTSYLHRKDVMSHIHISNKKSAWTECTDSVLKTFRACHSKPSIELLPDLLQQIPIVLYSGDYDLICNHWVTEKLMDTMTWNNETGFALGNGTFAPTERWIVENELAGLIRTARNLTYILFYNTSHMVPYNQARRSRAMLHQFIKLNVKSFIPSITEMNIQSTSQITHRTFKYILFIVLIIIILVCTSFISFFMYKRRQPGMPKSYSIIRMFRSKGHHPERQQLVLYSVLEDSNEFFRTVDNDISV